MASVAQIIIEVDDQGATKAFQRINAEAARLGPTLAPVQRISEQTFNNIEGGALKARESAALLGEEFGVKVPRALRGVIAESALIGPAFTAAFSGLAIIGFIEIAKQAIEQLTGFGEALKGIEKQNTALMQSVHDANKILLGPQNLEQITKKLGDAQKKVLELNEALGLTGDLFGDSLKTGLAKKFSAAGGILVEELDKAKTAVDELSLEYAKLKDAKDRSNAIEILKAQNAARLAGLEGFAKIEQAERGETQVLRAEIAKQIIDAAVGDAQINEIHRKSIAERKAFVRAEQDTTRHLAEEVFTSSLKGLNLIKDREEDQVAELKLLLERQLIDASNFEQRKLSIQAMADNQRLELAKQNAEEVMRAEESAAVAMLPPWQRAYAQMSIDTQRRLREIQKALDETRISAEDAARLSAAAWQEEFAKTRDKLASDLESAFDEITSGGIGKFFLKKFKHMVFEMVAAWILGMNQMKAASQQQMGSGGGILGAIFGSIFGGLGGIFGGGGGVTGGVGPGGTPPIFGFTGGNGDFGGETSGGSSGGVDRPRA